MSTEPPLTPGLPRPAFPPPEAPVPPDAEVYSLELHHEHLNAVLGQVNRACELLTHHPDALPLRRILLIKALIHKDLGNHATAAAALRQSDELFIAVERKGLVKAADHMFWRQVVCDLASIYLNSRQLEAAKSCFLRVLRWPRLCAGDRLIALKGMASYHKERKEWAEMSKCCEEGLALIPKAKEEGLVIDHAEDRLLLLLADAFEGQGNTRRAHECDEKAKKILVESGLGDLSVDFAGCRRRSALKLLAAGRTREAIEILAIVPEFYTQLQSSGINLMHQHLLQPVLAALKVLADALAQTGIADRVGQAECILADVAETEDILRGYWAGVLEKTRWEQRRAVPAEATKKSKAVKRKQQKRKAQQKKRAAEMAEATTAAGGEECTQGEDESGKDTQQEESDGLQEKGEEDSGTGQAVVPAAAAMAAMVVGEKEGKQEEEEEDECSVCLNALDGDDSDNPAGPPLGCGHRYHAFCLHFWVGNCTSKCIEPTCPYCRAPLVGM